jgi:hypothetical protein
MAIPFMLVIVAQSNNNKDPLDIWYHGSKSKGSDFLLAMLSG